MRRAFAFPLVLLAGVLGGLVPLSQATAAPAPPAAAERWALIVGIDHFLGATRPNFGAVNDAAVFRQALLKAGFAEDHIKVLTDGGARAADIRNGLQWLVDHSGPSSLSVIHYSGHVKQAGSTEYLWPHDNVFIPDTELAGKVHQLKGQAWVDISGCEAAGFDEAISGPNTLFTGSSRADEKSYEVPDLGHSIFTFLLVKKGMLDGEADANHDGRVSVQEAFAFAAPRAPQISSGQAQGPQHPVIAGGSGAPLFLDAVAVPPAPAPAAAPGKLCLLFLCF